MIVKSQKGVSTIHVSLCYLFYFCRLLAFNYNTFLLLIDLLFVYYDVPQISIIFNPSFWLSSFLSSFIYLLLPLPLSVSLCVRSLFLFFYFVPVSICHCVFSLYPSLSLYVFVLFSCFLFCTRLYLSLCSPSPPLSRATPYSLTVIMNARV